MAEHIGDPASKQLMLNVAGDYEELAKRAEERAAKSPPQSKEPPGIDLGDPGIQAYIQVLPRGRS
jgi:hypothetical protein